MDSVITYFSIRCGGSIPDIFVCVVTPGYTVIRFLKRPELSEHEPCEGEVMVSSEGVGETLVVSGESAESCGPAKFRSTAHRLGSGTKPRLAAVCLITSNWMPYF